MLPLLGGAALLRFLGDDLFVGESGSGGKFVIESYVSVGSTFSTVLARRVRAGLRGVGGTSVVFLRVWRRGLRCGAAGVKSSSSSSSLTLLGKFSSSDSSTNTFFRVAARLDGRAAGADDISFAGCLQITLQVAAGKVNNQSSDLRRQCSIGLARLRQHQTPAHESSRTALPIDSRNSLWRLNLAFLVICSIVA